ncbi:MAG: peptidylprolyl isomerase [Coprobacillus sp.]
MKQKQLMGLALASLLVLSGCSNTSTVKNNDGKYIVSSIDGKDILADDIYKNMTSTSTGKNALFSYVLDELVKANFPITSEMKENAAEIVKNIKANYKSQYSDEADAKLESALASSGYDSIEAYEESLVFSLQYSEFIKKYVKDNFDTVFEDYYKKENPKYMSIIKVNVADMNNVTTDEKAKLEEVTSLLKTDKSFEEIASQYSDDDATKSKKGSLGIVDSTSGLTDTYGEAVEKATTSLKVGSRSEQIKGEDGYYFLYASSNKKEDIKKELNAVDIDSPLLVYDTYIHFLVFNTYELKYGNEDTEKQIKQFVEDALKEREEARGGNS